MEAIYKYPFEIEDCLEINLPFGAHILTAFCQNDIPCLWALVQPGVGETQKRKFRIFGTGHPMPEDVDLKWIATFPQFNGKLIWHLFESSD